MFYHFVPVCPVALFYHFFETNDRKRSAREPIAGEKKNAKKMVDPNIRKKLEKNGKKTVRGFQRSGPPEKHALGTY